MVLQGYIPIFDGQKVGIYDLHNTKITVSQAAVLKGWCVSREGLWRILIARGVRARTANINTETVVSRVSPIKLLVADKPPPTITS